MISLELSIKDINIILQALGQAPYQSVVELIENIKQQAIPQAQATQTLSVSKES